VAQEDPRLAEYLVEYTIALLPDVKDEDFKPGQHLLRDAGFSLTQAHSGRSTCSTASRRGSVPRTTPISTCGRSEYSKPR
jgi:hypothetical protein